MENRDDQNKNQTGQQGQQFTDKQDKQGFGQQGQTSTGQTGSDQGALGESGDETTLAQGQKNEFDKQREEEGQNDKGFVGTKEADTSEAYLSEDQAAKSNFAEQGQGAAKSPAGNEDIESGTAASRDASLDDGS